MEEVTALASLPFAILTTTMLILHGNSKDELLAPPLDCTLQISRHT